MEVVSHVCGHFFSRNYTLPMQLISLLTASVIAAILLTQAVGTWNAPRERQTIELTVAAYRQAIRHTMSLAIATQQSIEVAPPETPLPVEIRTLAGTRITAYPDGTVSPGQLRVCGTLRDAVLSLSSLGRTALKHDDPKCESPTG